MKNKKPMFEDSKQDKKQDKAGQKKLDKKKKGK